MSLLAIKGGMLTTVQDLGRCGKRAFGINPNGVMDRTAAILVDRLLGNKEYEAVLEMHFPAGEFVFESECSFALGGGDLGAVLNEIEIDVWTTQTARKGDVLRFRERRNGSRAYLGVAGGFEVADWLGSKSTNLAAGAGGFEGRSLRPGDRIGFAGAGLVGARRLGQSLIPRYSRFPTVRVTAGLEFDELTAVSEQAFFAGGFTLAKDSNRMGFRLSGTPLSLLHNKELVSAAVTFGTIQLLPDGQLVVLMADHQTTGGYPRIANVITADLSLLAQLSPGDGVGFRLISIEDAEDVAIRAARELRFLDLGVRLRG